MKTTEKNQVKFLADGRGWRGGKEKKEGRQARKEGGRHQFKRKIEARFR